MTSERFPWTHMKASSTRPAGPSTGYSHPSCYAKELSDCSTGISKEHYISKGLLVEMGGKPQIAGFRSFRRKIRSGGLVLKPSLLVSSVSVTITALARSTPRHSDAFALCEPSMRICKTDERRLATR